MRLFKEPIVAVLLAVVAQDSLQLPMETYGSSRIVNTVITRKVCTRKNKLEELEHNKNVKY